MFVFVLMNILFVFWFKVIECIELLGNGELFIVKWSSFFLLFGDNRYVLFVVFIYLWLVLFIVMFWIVCVLNKNLRKLLRFIVWSEFK